MPITQNRSTNLTRRQSFNGKGLTFVEVIFAQSITASATTPESLDSVFDQVTKFYRHHDEYDDKMYEAYDLSFAVGFGDDDYLNFDTGWRDPGLEL